ncbi:hypothetical protein [Rhodococcus sp. NPDC127528]|uniref:hypothetical protein n=1 Tax=unclassified Rhodococcus (in: high G+C Gram-positive bacteria) TaxID=192944 RepID=UPI00363DA722
MATTVLPFDLLTAEPLRLLVGAGPGGVGPTGGGSSDDGGDNDGEADGGSDDDGGDDDTDGDNADGGDGDGDEDDKPLGPQGERALAALKEQRKTERARRIAAEKKNRQLEAQLAGKGSNDSDDEKSRIIEERVTARANQKILRAEVRAAAANKLADPSDAYKFLDLAQFEVGEDGDVDQGEIADAINDLIQSKPYLAAQGGTRKVPKPDRRQGGGAREATGTVSSGRAAYQARHQKKSN